MKTWLLIGAVLMATRFAMYATYGKIRRDISGWLVAGWQGLGGYVVIPFCLIVGALGVLFWPLGLIDVVWLLSGYRKPDEKL